jgi:hypothetical protein
VIAAYSFGGSQKSVHRVMDSGIASFIVVFELKADATVVAIRT